MAQHLPQSAILKPMQIARIAAIGSLMLMTVGFALYQFLLREGIIPPYLGGYLGVVGAGLVVPCLAVYLIQLLMQPWRLAAGDMLFALFAAMVGIVAAANYLGGRAVQVGESHLAILPQMMVFFVAFRFLDFEDRFVRLALWFSFVILTWIILFLDLGTFRTDYGSDLMLGVDASELAGYQHYGMTYFFLLLCVVCMTRQVALRGLIYIVGGITLFNNGARSEMIVLIPALLALEAHFSRDRIALLAIVGIILTLFMGHITEFLITNFPNNRVVLLLSEMSFDQSYVEREYLQQQALEVIRMSPIFGSYGYYTEGSYTHNMLSVWADFGLFGFALFIACLAAPLVAVFRNFGRHRNDLETLLLASFTVSSIAFFVFAKAYTHPILGVMLALYARDLNQRRWAKLSAKSSAPQPRRAAY